jgi:ERCC4-type nuclease
MLEHIDHTYRIIKHGYHPPFWWFADIEESSNYIEDLDPQHAKSTTRNNGRSYNMRARMNALYFALKHGSRLWQIPDVGEHEVERVLTELKQKNVRLEQR